MVSRTPGPGRRSRPATGTAGVAGIVLAPGASAGRDQPAAALILVSYPLHPPGRPERRRDEHFPAIAVPCLFLSGTKDAFGAPDELEEATAAIPGPVTHVWVDGGDHGLRGRDAQVAGTVREWVAALRH